MQSPVPQERIKQNLVSSLMLAAFWLVVVLGCGNNRAPSSIVWTQASCAAPDKSRFGEGGLALFLIDLKTGEIKKHLETAGSVLCFPNDDIVSGGEAKLTWLTSDKHIEGKFDWQDFPLDDEHLVSNYQRVERDKNGIKYLKEPLEITVSYPNSPLKPKKRFALDYRLFPGVGGYEFRAIFIDKLNDKRLLFAAGEKPPSGVLAHPKTPWGFFTVDVESETVESFGGVLTSDDEDNLSDYVTPFDVTSDGKIIVGVFGNTVSNSPKTLAAFAAGKETAQTKIENAEYVSSLRINAGGLLLSVRITGEKASGWN